MSILAYTSLPTCSSWMSTPCKMLPEKAFCRVPRGVLRVLSFCCSVQPVHMPLLLSFPCFLTGPAVVVSTSTTLSTANSMAAAIKVPGTDSIPHCPACLSFCTAPLEGQEAPALSPLIPCSRIGKNTCLSPWCHILVERPQSKVAWLPVPNCGPKSIDGSTDCSVLSKTVSSLGSTIDPRVGLAKK